RRMMLIEASWPSNRLAAVTNRTGWTGRCRSGEGIGPDYLDVKLPVEGRPPSRASRPGRWGAMTLEVRDIEYVRYLMQHLSIPPASEGWQFYQPPLYYAVGAAWGTVTGFFSAPLPGSLQFFAFLLSLLGIGCVLWIGATLCAVRRERGALALFLASATLLPGIVFFAARANNDVLALALSLLCTALLLRWWRHPERSGLWAGIAVVLSLGILTKSTTLPLVAAAWLLLLLSPLRWRKKLGLGIVSLAVILLLTDWLFIQRYIVEGNRGLVGNLGNLHSGLRLRNFPSAFLRFNPLFLFGHPYNNPWDDASGRQFLWEYVFRSAFSGEWSFGPGLRPLVSALHALGLFALSLAPVGILRRPRQELRRSLPLLLLLAMFLAAIAAIRFTAPYGSSQDFRYIAPAAVPLAYFAVRGALALPRRLRQFALALLAAVPLGSAAFVLALVFGR
ncbi:MAG: glycosyltransferase family 39 protein, partial [Patescibacteria group bacterium]